MRDSLVEKFYSFAGEVEVSFEVNAGSECCALDVPAGVWHTLRLLESSTEILEEKDGKYVPMGEEDVMNMG